MPKVLTLGQRRIRVFISSENENQIVNAIKSKAADLIDLINQIAPDPNWNQETTAEFHRLKSLSMTHIG